MITLIEGQRKRGSQVKSIEHFNSEQVQMLSCSDCFQLDQESILQVRKKDFSGWNILMSSTQIDYVNNTVTHDVNSTVVKPTVIKLKEIPVCEPTYIKDLVATKEGLDYLRALCNDMKLTAEQVIAKFEGLSGKRAEEIRFWTLNIDERKRQSIGAVLLFFYNGWFGCNARRLPDFGSDNFVARGVRQSVPIAKQQEALP